MTTGGSGAQRQTKNERRDLAREKAREARLRQQRRERRNRVLLQSGIGLAVLAAVAIIALVLVNSIRPPGAGPKNMADGGIVLTQGLKAEPTAGLASGGTPKQRAPQSGKVAIRVYEDFGCPICNEFEKTDSAYIRDLVNAGKATLQIYPVAILDHNFQTNYSTRAANAAAAVANFSPDRFYAFHTVLFAHQPEEESSGRTDDELIAYAKEAKVTNLDAVTKAIRDKTYYNWVGNTTERFTSAKYPDTDVQSLADIARLTKNPQVSGVGTPTVFVSGKFYTGQPDDATAFKNFVRDSGSGFTPTPSASPTQSKDVPSPSPTKSK